MERAGVIETLAAIERAARSGRNEVRHRKTNYRKQRIIDVACSFFAEFSPRKPSTTETAEFIHFAKAFHTAVTGKDEGVTTQVRRAVKKFNGAAPSTELH
jgi:hypothetical protein